MSLLHTLLPTVAPLQLFLHPLLSSQPHKSVRIPASNCQLCQPALQCWRTPFILISHRAEFVESSGKGCSLFLTDVGKKTMEHFRKIKFSTLFHLYSLVELILSRGRSGSSQCTSEMEERGEGGFVFPLVNPLVTAV